VAIARLRVTPLALHSDRAGGLEVLALPVFPFAIGVAGLSSVVAASWATRLLAEEVALSALAPALSALVVMALVVGLLPLAVFAPAIARARVDGLRRFSALSRSYARLFEARWLDGRGQAGGPSADDPALLGAPDLQSLADLHSAYAAVRDLRPLPFTRREVLQLTVAVVAPMVPLVLTVMSPAELLGQATRILLGAIGR
jgi:hypothetical protein